MYIFIKCYVPIYTVTYIYNLELSKYLCKTSIRLQSCRRLLYWLKELSKGCKAGYAKFLFSECWISCNAGPKCTKWFIQYLIRISHEFCNPSGVLLIILWSLWNLTCVPAAMLQWGYRIKTEHPFLVLVSARRRGRWQSHLTEAIAEVRWRASARVWGLKLKPRFGWAVLIRIITRRARILA